MINLENVFANTTDGWWSVTGNRPSPMVAEGLGAVAVTEQPRLETGADGQVYATDGAVAVLLDGEAQADPASTWAQFPVIRELSANFYNTRG